MKIVETVDVEAVRQLAEVWAGMANGEEFGLDVDVDVAIGRLDALMQAGGSMLVAYDGGEPVGFFSLSPVPSTTGRQMVAVETYWFALPNSLTAGPRLLQAAKRWASEHDCPLLMVSGSKLASGMHDAVCRFCERAGGKQFETVYIMECV